MAEPSVTRLQTAFKYRASAVESPASRPSRAARTTMSGETLGTFNSHAGIDMPHVQGAHHHSLRLQNSSEIVGKPPDCGLAADVQYADAEQVGFLDFARV